MNVTIKPLPPSRTHDARRVLLAAFAEDPVFSWFFPDLGVRSRVLNVIFSNLILANIRFESVWVALADNEIVGAAIWQAPTARDSVWDHLRSAWTFAQIKWFAGPNAEGIRKVFNQLAPLHPTEPHWYLAFVGIDPARQAQGIGKRLLMPVLSEADARQQACYLETPFLQSHAFYRRLGFELLDERTALVGAPPIWRFLRKPNDGRA